eukprot:PhF_6_TR25685/c0_g1_i3/m.36203
MNLHTSAFDKSSSYHIPSLPSTLCDDMDSSTFSYSSYLDSANRRSLEDKLTLTTALQQQKQQPQSKKEDEEDCTTTTTTKRQMVKHLARIETDFSVTTEDVFSMEL